MRLDAVASAGMGMSRSKLKVNENELECLSVPIYTHTFTHSFLFYYLIFMCYVRVHIYTHPTYTHITPLVGHDRKWRRIGQLEGNQISQLPTQGRGHCHHPWQRTAGGQ